MNDLNRAMDEKGGRGWVTYDGRHQVDILRDGVRSLRTQLAHSELASRDLEERVVGLGKILEALKDKKMQDNVDLAQKIEDAEKETETWESHHWRVLRRAEAAESRVAESEKRLESICETLSVGVLELRDAGKNGAADVLKEVILDVRGTP